MIYCGLYLAIHVAMEWKTDVVWASSQILQVGQRRNISVDQLLIASSDWTLDLRSNLFFQAQNKNVIHVWSCIKFKIFLWFLNENTPTILWRNMYSLISTQLSDKNRVRMIIVWSVPLHDNPWKAWRLKDKLEQSVHANNRKQGTYDKN